MSGDNPAYQAPHKPALFSVYVTDNTAQAGTAVDCLGYGRLAAFIHLGDVTASASETITIKLQAGDASNGSDAVDLTTANFPSLANSMTTGALTVANALDNTMRVLFLDLHKVNKRYVRAVATLSAVTTKMQISVVFALGLRGDSAKSADYSQFISS